MSQMYHRTIVPQSHVTIVPKKLFDQLYSFTNYNSNNNDSSNSSNHASHMTVSAWEEHAQGLRAPGRGAAAPPALPGDRGTKGKR